MFDFWEFIFYFTVSKPTLKQEDQMKLLAKISFALIIFLNSAINSQWISINSGTNDYLFSCFFVNSQTGYVGGQDGSGRIYKTINGGQNWSMVFEAAGDRFESMFFLNDQTGWAGTYYNLVYKTTDGGANWTYAVANGRVRRIVFINNQTGWLVGSNGCKKTTNGGASWLTIIPGLTGFGIHFFDLNTGIVSSHGNNVCDLYRTTNGGANWSVVYSEPNGTGINNFSFINDNTGFAVGNYRVTIKTTNRGQSWSHVSKDPLNSTVINDLRGVKFIDQNLGYSCGQFIIPGPSTYYGAVFDKTTDGGLTWQFMTTTPHYSSMYAFEDLQIADGQTGFVVGSAGKIYKSTNAGYVGINPISTEFPNHFSLSQNYPNPFNPSTTFEFSIPRSGFVNLTIYDAIGKTAGILQNGELKPGTYKAGWDASNFPSGIYFYRLSTESYSDTKKMILVK